MEQSLVWDHAALLTRVRGKPDRMAKLIGLYLDDMPNRLTLLSEQVSAADMTEISETAHTIKGVSANLGILRLQSKAAELEQAAKNAESEKTRALLAEVEREYEQSETALKAYLAAL